MHPLPTVLFIFLALLSPACRIDPRAAAPRVS
jgi:hypothetical protein